jgi:hypothetical protein
MSPRVRRRNGAMAETFIINRIVISAGKLLTHVDVYLSALRRHPAPPREFWPTGCNHGKLQTLHKILPIYASGPGRHSAPLPSRSGRMDRLQACTITCQNTMHSFLCCCGAGCEHIFTICISRHRGTPIQFRFKVLEQRHDTTPGLLNRLVKSKDQIEPLHSYLSSSTAHALLPTMVHPSLNETANLRWGLPSVPPPTEQPLAYVIVAFLLLLAVYSTGEKKANIPALNPPRSMLRLPGSASAQQIQDFIRHSKDLIKAGGARYPDQPYRLYTYLGDAVVLPPKFINEIRNDPGLDLQLVAEKGSNQLLTLLKT